MLSVPLAIALAVIAAEESAAPALSPLETKREAILKDLAEARLELAAFALEKDLFLEANDLLKDAAAVLPEDATAALAGKLDALDPATYPQRYKDAAKKSGAELRKRRGAVEKPAAAALVALAEEAAKAGDGAFAEDACVRAYRVDARNAAALKLLKAKDYDAIFNYGALPRADKLEARAVLKRLGGNFLGENDLKKELEFWSDAWGLKTRHYRFVTNAPHGTVFRFAEACEHLFDAWEDVMKGAKYELRKLKDPATVYLFDSPRSYQAILRLVDQDPPANALGFYTSQTDIGYFYDDPSYYMGDLGELLETFFHEGTHQLLDLRVKAPWKGDIAKFPLHWAEEGFATFMESLAIQGQGDAAKTTLAQEIDDDLRRALEAAATGKLMPSAEFIHAVEEAWDGYDLGYPHAALFTHWLLEADGGANRKVGFELLARYLSEGGLRDKDAFALLKKKPDEIDAALKAYAAKLDRSLKKRRYVSDGPAEEEAADGAPAEKPTENG